jgi:hypothetical protein
MINGPLTVKGAVTVPVGAIMPFAGKLSEEAQLDCKDRGQSPMPLS